jgi:hypothetical protein
VPYEGHELTPDFRRFASDPIMAFEDDLAGIYELPKEQEEVPLDAGDRF